MQVVAEYEGVQYDLVHVDPAKGEGVDEEPYKSNFPWRKVSPKSTSQGSVSPDSLSDSRPRRRRPRFLAVHPYRQLRRRHQRRQEWSARKDQERKGSRPAVGGLCVPLRLSDLK